MFTKYKRAKNNKKLICKENYNKYRNVYNKLIRKAKYNYYKELFEISKGDSKKTWEIINSLLNNKSKTIDINEIKYKYRIQGK